MRIHPDVHIDKKRAETIVHMRSVDFRVLSKNIIIKYAYQFQITMLVHLCVHLSIQNVLIIICNIITIMDTPGNESI